MKNIEEEIHGFKVSDPYRWLEDAEDPEVKEWIAAQNDEVYKTLKSGSFDVFSSELAKNFKVTAYSNPTAVKGKYFYSERQPNEDQKVLYVKVGLEGTPVVLFDPNGKRDGNTVTIDYWMESNTGKYVMYGVSEGGDEMSTLYIKDTDTNEELAEKIIHCRYTSLEWLPDDSGFYYTRTARPGTVPKDEEHLHAKVFLHMLGDNPDADELIFGEGRPSDDMIVLSLSPDGRYLGLQVSQKWTENEIYIYDTVTKETKRLEIDSPSKSSLRFLEDKVLMVTNYQANNYKVLSTTYDDLYKPLAEWSEFIPEREFLLSSFKVTKSKLLAEYLVNVCSEVVIFDYEGDENGKIPLPKYTSLEDISARRDEEEFFYGVNSFVFPTIFYRYDPVAQSYSEYRKIDNPITPEDYEVSQEWFASKDGTRVPMFIIRKKDVVIDSKNPTILYGYGGFNINLTPSFMRGWASWMEKGGIFVIANIRGGGEFGSAWHKGGIKENKQKSFDDFIAAGEYLISEKYTSSQHLGILGASNGGLLVSAVGVQRPDLWKAVCSKVPLTDMVRFSKFGMAVRWIHEYGNPEVKEELENILKWSPYHNVKEGMLYPDFFFTTADKDTRVNPLHARKMGAILKSCNTENNVLVLTEMDSGHGSGKPIVKLVETQALVLSFFATKLGLKVIQP